MMMNANGLLQALKEIPLPCCVPNFTILFLSVCIPVALLPHDIPSYPAQRVHVHQQPQPIR